jgi:hypothetical protein
MSDEPLLKFPTIALIVGPFNSGKTRALEFMLLQQHDKIAAVVLFSNTGKDAWKQNYSWLNPRYIYDGRIELGLYKDRKTEYDKCVTYFFLLSLVF